MAWEMALARAQLTQVNRVMSLPHSGGTDKTRRSRGCIRFTWSNRAGRNRCGDIWCRIGDRTRPIDRAETRRLLVPIQTTANRFGLSRRCPAFEHLSSLINASFRKQGRMSHRLMKPGRSRRRQLSEADRVVRADMRTGKHSQQPGASTGQIDYVVVAAHID